MVMMSVRRLMSFITVSLDHSTRSCLALEKAPIYPPEYARDNHRHEILLYMLRKHKDTCTGIEDADTIGLELVRLHQITRCGRPPETGRVG